uniref:Integral membrane protein TerC n=1 Tax=uncultured bacterium contig00009 TaxID=1181501 RepID=A0A806JZU4_9BACT|nr:integral membrane protein TerC [uncultured bacterium contig00009]
MLILLTGFIILVVGLLVLDLGVFHKKDHVISVKEALVWTVFWVACAMLFAVFVYFAYENHWFGIGTGAWKRDGHQAAIEYITGYLIEKSLSLDNIFVIAIIISSFGIPKEMQHRVLFWGILGALVMRGAMIMLGTALIMKFGWILYVFGAFLIIIAIKTAFSKHEEEKFDADKSAAVKILRKIFPVSSRFYGHHFFSRENGKLAATPLFAALIVIEFSDLIFAIDSIPAIFAITIDPFIVFTSNIFAILGLRSLFFALSALIDKFTYLKYSLALILLFVGLKMQLPLFGGHIGLPAHLPAHVSLAVICFFLLLGILASKIFKKPVTGSDFFSI